MYVSFFPKNCSFFFYNACKSLLRKFQAEEACKGLSKSRSLQSEATLAFNTITLMHVRSCQVQRKMHKFLKIIFQRDMPKRGKKEKENHNASSQKRNLK